MIGLRQICSSSSIHTSCVLPLEDDVITSSGTPMKQVLLAATGSCIQAYSINSTRSGSGDVADVTMSPLPHLLHLGGTALKIVPLAHQCFLVWTREYELIVVRYQANLQAPIETSATPQTHCVSSTEEKKGGNEEERTGPYHGHWFILYKQVLPEISSHAAIFANGEDTGADLPVQEPLLVVSAHRDCVRGFLASKWLHTVHISFARVAETPLQSPHAKMLNLPALPKPAITPHHAPIKQGTPLASSSPQGRRRVPLSFYSTRWGRSTEPRTGYTRGEYSFLRPSSSNDGTGRRKDETPAQCRRRQEEAWMTFSQHCDIPDEDLILSHSITELSRHKHAMTSHLIKWTTARDEWLPRVQVDAVEVPSDVLLLVPFLRAPLPPAVAEPGVNSPKGSLTTPFNTTVACAQCPGNRLHSNAMSLWRAANAFGHLLLGRRRLEVTSFDANSTGVVATGISCTQSLTNTTTPYYAVVVPCLNTDNAIHLGTLGHLVVFSHGRSGQYVSVTPIADICEEGVDVRAATGLARVVSCVALQTAPPPPSQRRKTAEGLDADRDEEENVTRPCLLWLVLDDGTLATFTMPVTSFQGTEKEQQDGLDDCEMRGWPAATIEGLPENFTAFSIQPLRFPFAEGDDDSYTSSSEDKEAAIKAAVRMMVGEESVFPCTYRYALLSDGLANVYAVDLIACRVVGAFTGDGAMVSVCRGAGSDEIIAAHSGGLVKMITPHLPTITEGCIPSAGSGAWSVTRLMPVVLGGTHTLHLLVSHSHHSSVFRCPINTRTGRLECMTEVRPGGAAVGGASSPFPSVQYISTEATLACASVPLLNNGTLAQCTTRQLFVDGTAYELPTKAATHAAMAPYSYETASAVKGTQRVSLVLLTAATDTSTIFVLGTRKDSRGAAHTEVVCEAIACKAPIAGLSACPPTFINECSEGKPAVIAVATFIALLWDCTACIVRVIERASVSFTVAHVVLERPSWSIFGGIDGCLSPPRSLAPLSSSSDSVPTTSSSTACWLVTHTDTTLSLLTVSGAFDAPTCSWTVTDMGEGSGGGICGAPSTAEEVSVVVNASDPGARGVHNIALLHGAKVVLAAAVTGEERPCTWMRYARLLPGDSQWRHAGVTSNTVGGSEVYVGPGWRCGAVVEYAVPSASGTDYVHTVFAAGNKGITVCSLSRAFRHDADTAALAPSCSDLAFVGRETYSVVRAMQLPAMSPDHTLVKAVYSSRQRKILCFIDTGNPAASTLVLAVCEKSLQVVDALQLPSWESALCAEKVPELSDAAEGRADAAMHPTIGARCYTYQDDIVVIGTGVYDKSFETLSQEHEAAGSSREGRDDPSFAGRLLVMLPEPLTIVSHADIKKDEPGAGAVNAVSIQWRPAPLSSTSLATRGALREALVAAACGSQVRLYYLQGISLILLSALSLGTECTAVALAFPSLTVCLGGRCNGYLHILSTNEQPIASGCGGKMAASTSSAATAAAGGGGAGGDISADGATAPGVSGAVTTTTTVYNRVATSSTWIFALKLKVSALEPVMTECVAVRTFGQRFVRTDQDGNVCLTYVDTSQASAMAGTESISEYPIIGLNGCEAPITHCVRLPSAPTSLQVLSRMPCAAARHEPRAVKSGEFTTLLPHYGSLQPHKSNGTSRSRGVTGLFVPCEDGSLYAAVELPYALAHPLLRLEQALTDMYDCMPTLCVKRVPWAPTRCATDCREKVELQYTQHAVSFNSEYAFNVRERVISKCGVVVLDALTEVFELQKLLDAAAAGDVVESAFMASAQLADAQNRHISLKEIIEKLLFEEYDHELTLDVIEEIVQVL